MNLSLSGGGQSERATVRRKGESAEGRAFPHRLLCTGLIQRTAGMLLKPPTQASELPHTMENHRPETNSSTPGWTREPECRSQDRGATDLETVQGRERQGSSGLQEAMDT